MKHTQRIPRQLPSNAHPMPVEELPPNLPLLPRLTLGGAIGGSFAGSFAGALLGMAIGILYRDISLGLDGALLGGVIAAIAGAAYGLILALRDKRVERKSAEG